MLCTFTAFGSGSAGSSVAAMSRTCASPSGELREFANVLNAADADSIYLYLPRNLSSCHMCAEVEEQHLEHKMKLLASFLRRESLDSGDDDVLSMKPIPTGSAVRVSCQVNRACMATTPAANRTYLLVLLTQPL